MLYSRWQRVVENQPHRWALRTAQRQWTFSQLDEAICGRPLTAGPVQYPQGPEFILSVLAAWRDNRVVCPLEPGQPAPDLPPPGGEIIHLKSTSATTGISRWVGFTALQLMADADQIVTTMGLRLDWPNVGTISLAHSYGFSNLVLPLLLHGIPLVLTEALPETLKHLLNSGDHWTIPAVPALWRAWHEAGVVSLRVRLAISAGAPLSVELERKVFQRSGVKLHNFYGATECGGIAYDGSLRPRADPREVGSALRGVQLTVGEEGCLEVRGRAVGQTYWPQPDPALAGGCYRTSDLAQLTNGNLLLLGRANDQINVAGRKVFPEAIEEKLRRHPYVRDCLVFGVPSLQGDRSEAIVACVAADAGQVAEDDLRRHLLAELPAWQLPRHWWFVPSLPMNQRGKISRADYRRRYLARTPDRG